MGTPESSVRSAQGCPQPDTAGSRWLQPTHTGPCSQRVCGTLGKTCLRKIKKCCTAAVWERGEHMWEEQCCRHPGQCKGGEGAAPGTGADAPLQPWCRLWWGSSAPAAHGGPQGREDPHYSQWRTPCQSRWMCCGESWNCWRATLDQEKNRRKEWHTGSAMGWSQPSIPHPPALLSMGGSPVVRNEEGSLNLKKKGTVMEGIGFLLFLSNWVYFNWQ